MEINVCLMEPGCREDWHDLLQRLRSTEVPTTNFVQVLGVSVRYNGIGIA